MSSPQTAELPEYPWDAFKDPAPTAHPPANTDLPDNPWDTFGPAPTHNLSDRTPGNFLEPQVSDNPPAGAEVPFEQRLADNIQTVGSGMGVGALAGSVIAGVGGKAMGLFETPESLKSAGISAKALENMVPGSVPPGEYVQAVQKQLQNNRVLAKTANETWKLINSAKETAGQNIGAALEKISQVASPDALSVNAQEVLDPLATEALKRGTGLYSKTENLANPFYQAYDGLTNIAKEQGGKLTLDNLEAALYETGQMMDEGGEQAEATFGKVYGKLADVRDLIVNRIAQNAGDPELATQLLKNNADYSTYSRILPSVQKTAFREAIKEGVSAYQKHIGPLGEKLLAVGGIYGATRAIMDKILGNH